MELDFEMEGKSPVKNRTTSPKFVRLDEVNYVEGNVPTKLGIATLTVVQVLVAVLINWLILWLSFQSSIKGLTDDFREQIASSVREAEIKFLQNSSVATAIMGNEFIARVCDCDQDKIRRHLFTVIQQYPKFTYAGFARPDGTFIGYERDHNGALPELILVGADSSRGRYITDHRGVPLKLISTLDDYNCTTRPWYRNAIGGYQQKWSDIFFDFFTVGGNCVASVFPLFDKGRLLGVLGTAINVDTLSNFLSEMKYGSTGSAMIIERSGHLVASSVLKFSEGCEVNYD
jgi:hypothetical protein